MKKSIINILAILGCVVLIQTSCQEKDEFPDHIEFTKPMIFRPDSSYYTCVKYVPELGYSVPIKGNAYINILSYAFGFACYNYTDTVNWRNEEFWAFMNEVMGASGCELKLGKISLGGNDVNFDDCIEGTCSLSKWNHDIPLSSYDEDPDKSSWLEITAIDSSAKFVEGKFQFHFVFDYQDDYTSPAFAKKISYVNGKFRAKANL